MTRDCRDNSLIEAPTWGSGSTSGVDGSSDFTHINVERSDCIARL
ncbi:hypothetical protein [Sphingomonas paucimobilis]|nr:hypothetical protein [Sphingomonas paucimobilis]